MPNFIQHLSNYIFPSVVYGEIPYIDWLIYFFQIILLSLAISVPLILVVAYTVLFERKVMALMQRRIGPNVVGPYGSLQPIADAMKLLFKEIIFPRESNKFLFILAPIITFTLAQITFAVIPFADGVILADINLALLYIFAISSLGIYGIIIAGWSSNSKYPFLSAIRSAAQMVSYEVSIGFIFIIVLMLAGSLSLNDIVLAQADGWFIWPLFPIFVIFVICTLAETNRTPFDLPEGESELVAGFFVEYSSMPFALFFLGEYANILLMSCLTSILFLGGYLAPFDSEIIAWIHPSFWLAIKTALMVFVFVWVRASLPRFRYDQLMRLGWKIFLPISLIYLVAVATYLTFF